MTEPDEIPAAAESKPDTRTAKIRALDTIKARGFTLGKNSTVDRVPLAHAEYLVTQGKAEILEVS